MHSGEKRAKLLEVLRQTPKPPVLIFANSHHRLLFPPLTFPFPCASPVPSQATSYVYFVVWII